MERCNVCSEKSYLAMCAHCDKKICEDCKRAHMDILRREITRINSQVRRSIHRLQDILGTLEKNTVSLQTNCVSVSDEVDEINRRLARALKDRTETIRFELDRYLTTEMQTLTELKHNLELEITNIQSNCDVAEKYMHDSVEWDDCELMDTKEIFLKTVEFIRNFEYENGDYNRRVRFHMTIDPNQLVNNVSAYGDLNITAHPTPGQQNSSGMLQPPGGAGLSRSKSDHRLTIQFRQEQERAGYGIDDESVMAGRRFGDRQQKAPADRYGDSSRYGRTDYDNEYDDSSSRAPKSRFRSRFVRSHQQDNDSDTEQSRNVRFDPKDKEKERDKILDTEDVYRGSLSGIIRLSDSPRVIKKLQDVTREKPVKKEPKVDPAKAAAAAAKKPVAPVAIRQMTEDEIERMKKQNLSVGYNPPPMRPAAATSAEAERPKTDRVAALKRNEGSSSSGSRTQAEVSS